MTIVPTPQASAVAATVSTVTRPFSATGNVMAELVTGAGTGTISVQFAGSNDGTNYTSIGSAVTSTNRAVALSPNGEVYQYYRATRTVSTNTLVNDVTFYFA
jgi:class 3 adenylate cyclase